MLLMSHISWLKRYTIPSLILTLLVMAWSAGFDLYIYVIRGITKYLSNGLPATNWDVFWTQSIGCAIGVALIHVLVLLVLFIGRVPFRWDIMVIEIIVIGSLIMYAISNPLAGYLKANINSDYMIWASQIIVLLLCWAVTLAFGKNLPYYRIIVIRTRKHCISPCPRCGYDLYMCENYECPECGWQIPRYLWEKCGGKKRERNGVGPRFDGVDGGG